MQTNKQWLMLIYKVPRKPTASRVYVWRKLKQLGAVMLQDAVWILPDTERTAEQFQWLAAEITELAGEATLWKSALFSGQQESAVVALFNSRTEEVYREILASLKRSRPDLAELGRKFQQALSQDYFQSKLGKEARMALLAAGRKERDK